jgi:hypothetical protein
MALDQTSFAAALKTLYPSEVVRNLAYKNNPLLALIPKDETFYGDSSKEPIVIGTPQNRSASFSGANVSTTNSQIRAFLITRKTNYSMASIANETLEASQSDKGAFMKAVQFEIDQALLALTRSLAVQMYRSGTGTVARISATATLNSASTPVALEIPDQATNLEVGMTISFSATDGGAAKAGTAWIVSVDRAAGSFLCSATFGGAPAALNSLVGTVAVSDYIYQAAGDINATMSGLTAWLAGSDIANTGDSFFGVNRASDKVRLGGIKVDGSALTIEAALISAATLAAREGGRPDYAFVSFRDWNRLIAELGAKVQYVDVNVSEAEVKMSFSGLKVNGANGVITVVPDQNCPAGVAFVLQMDTWKLKSLGEAVRLFNADGLTMIRDSSSDSLLVRAFSYANLSCRAPGFNARVILPA